jgi:hypothetical protein
MSEFLLAGGETLHSVWPEAAVDTGLLLCSNGHNDSCSWQNGCGIGNQTVRYNVIPITSVDGFDSAEFDTLLLVTLSKNNLKVDKAVAESVIQTLLIRLQEKGVAIFESQTVGGQRIWQEFR